MPFNERKLAILKLLSEDKDVSLTKLQKLLHYSSATIRRDVATLEGEGLLRRSHGMIHAVNPHFGADDQKETSGFPHNLRSKHLIARKALEMITPGQNVILDSGTTTMELSRLLTDISITVVTNSLEIPMVLSHSKAQIISCGGLLQPSQLCYLGPHAEHFFDNIEAEILFIGTEGIRNQQGLTCSSPLQYNIKQAMIKAAKKRIVLADLSKLNTACLFMFSDFSNIDAIITIRPEEGSHEAEMLHTIHTEKNVDIFFADNDIDRMPR